MARLTLEPEPKVEGALLALDVQSGAVRAMVGGYDFERSEFNRATQARRQVGSAFKPIVYAAAIETLGWTPTTTILDAPLRITDPWDKSVWSPQNYDLSYMGPITLRRAVEQSRNIPAVKTLQAVGMDTGIEYAKRLGLDRGAAPLPSHRPGAGEATLIEMVGAFATFANQGLRMRPYLIERIEDRNGNLIEETRPRATRRDPGRHRLHRDQPAPGGGASAGPPPGHGASAAPSPARRGPPTTTPTRGSSATSRRWRRGSGWASTRR